MFSIGDTVRVLNGKYVGSVGIVNSLDPQLPEKDMTVQVKFFSRLGGLWRNRTYKSGDLELIKKAPAEEDHF